MPHKNETLFIRKKGKAVSINLNQKNIDPTASAFRQMMANLQGNILKSHGREHTRHIFFSFGADVTKNKGAIKSLLLFLTSSVKQLKTRKRVLTAVERKFVFGNFFLTAKGYEKLGFSRQEVLDAFPENGSIKFTDGMIAARAELSDLEKATWDKTYKEGAIDA